MPRFWRFLRISMLGIGVFQSILLWLIIDGSLIPGTLATEISQLTGASTSSIPYQGRLADSAGNAIDGRHSMTFRLYPAENSASAVWAEVWDGTNQVSVQHGLFNVMLGKITPIPQTVITSNSTLWLGITVGSDAELTPRVQLGSVPYAIQALTVPDGSLTTSKLADGAVTASKLAPGLLKPTTYALTTDTTTTTTSSANIVFGTITLSETSDLHITSRLIVENDSSNNGMSINLLINGVNHDIHGGYIQFLAGIGTTISRNYVISDLPAGQHTIIININQSAFQTNNTLKLLTGSTLWLEVR